MNILWKTSFKFSTSETHHLSNIASLHCISPCAQLPQTQHKLLLVRFINQRLRAKLSPVGGIFLPASQCRSRNLPCSSYSSYGLIGVFCHVFEHDLANFFALTLHAWRLATETRKNTQRKPANQKREFRRKSSRTHHPSNGAPFCCGGGGSPTSAHVGICDFKVAVTPVTNECKSQLQLDLKTYAGVLNVSHCFDSCCAS
jgi:hypothetical protein